MRNIGYPAEYLLKAARVADGSETKKTIAYVPGAEPGDISITGSKGRPLYAIDVQLKLKVLNTPNDETAVGSGLFVCNRLFDKFHTSDGYDVLHELGLDCMAGIQNAFFSISCVETFDNILQTSHDVLRMSLLLPCYSEIPVTLSIKLANLALEYTGGTITFDTDVNSLVISGLYGDELLGHGANPLEQPILEQHAEDLAAGRGTLESIRTVKPFYGALICRDSYAVSESLPHINGNWSLVEMKDEFNEVEYAISMLAMQRYRDDDSECVRVLTDRLGHINQGHSEVAVTVTNATALKYVALFSPVKGRTTKKVAKTLVSG